MILVHSEINAVFDTDKQYVNTVVIENANFFYSFISEISNQINGYSGKLLLSRNNTPVSISKNMEMLSCFVPFDMNKKTLINKIAARLEKTLADEEHYIEAMELLGRIELLLNDIAFQCVGNISYSNMSFSSLIKAASPVINDDYDSLGEKILDYMELVYEYECRKLFITVNLRSYLDEHDSNMFMKSAIMHGYDLIMLENHEYSLCEFEKRLVIDNDLCEIT